MSVNARPRDPRFLPETAGVATLEFVIVVPLVFSVFFWMFEAGWYMSQQAMLYRGMDLAMAELKLSRDPADEAAVRRRVCDEAIILIDCENTLVVELTPVRDGETVGRRAACVDRDNEENIRPATVWTPGSRRQLMFMRLCKVVDPLMPGIGFWATMAVDSQGGVALTAFTAFMNEPE